MTSSAVGEGTGEGVPVSETIPQRRSKSRSYYFIFSFHFDVYTEKKVVSTSISYIVNISNIFYIYLIYYKFKECCKRTYTNCYRCLEPYP